MEEQRIREQALVLIDVHRTSAALRPRRTDGDVIGAVSAKVTDGDSLAELASVGVRRADAFIVRNDQR